MNATGWLLSATVSVILGLAVNECSELSPALARRLVWWSARRRYRDTVRAAERAEELAAYINDRPGKLFKLIVAFGFAARALARTGERSPKPATVVSPGSVIVTPSHQPKLLTLDLKFAPYHDEDAKVWPQRAQQMRREWDRLCHDVDAAIAACGKHYYLGYESYRLERLAKYTRNPGWALIADNVARLDWALFRLKRMPDEGAGPYIGSCAGRASLRPIRNTTPTQAQVVAFCEAVRRCRDDIGQLAASRGDATS